MTDKNGSLLPVLTDGLTKKAIEKIADQAVSNILDQGVNAFRVAETMAAMTEFIAMVRKDQRFVSFLRDELAKEHNRKETGSGALIESCEAGVSYNYSSNPAWVELDTQIKELTEKRKVIEEEMRKLQPGEPKVDTETGEILYTGPLKSSTSTYKVTLKK